MSEPVSESLATSTPVSALLAASDVPTAPGEISLSPTARSAILLELKQIPGNGHDASEGIASSPRSAVLTPPLARSTDLMSLFL